MTGTEAASGRGHLETDERRSRGWRRKLKGGPAGSAGRRPSRGNPGAGAHQPEDSWRGRGSRSKAGGAAVPKQGGRFPGVTGLVWPPSPCCPILPAERSHAWGQPGCLFSVNEPSMSCQTLLPGIASGPKEYLTTSPGVDTSETRGIPSLMGSYACGHRHSYMQTRLGPDPARTICLFRYPRDIFFSSFPPHRSGFVP